jgi:hypothetical protein
MYLYASRRLLARYGRCCGCEDAVKQSTRLQLCEQVAAFIVGNTTDQSNHSGTPVHSGHDSLLEQPLNGKA